MVDDASAPGTPDPSAPDRTRTEPGGVDESPPSAGGVTAAPVTGAATSPAPLVRILPLPAPSQRAVLIIGAAIVLGVVLWMGREAIAPFVVGLLLVYLLDPL